MLTEKILREQIYNVDSSITIKTYNIIERDGVEISRSIPFIKTLAPGDDFTNEDNDTQKMCNVLWTRTIINNYKALQAAQNDAANL